MLDVTPFVPEARSQVLAAARVYIAHTQPWFVGLLAHGSALKGGFIPGGSDIDLQLFLDGAAFGPDGQMPLSVSLDLHRDLSMIDPAPFQYIQCYALPTTLTAAGKGSLGPIPGTYHMVAGRLPIPEATEVQVRVQAARLLAEARPDPGRAASKLLQHGGGRFEATVRFVCTDVWPTLYSVLVMRSDNPLAVWALPKEAAVKDLAEIEPVLGGAVRAFYKSVLRYYTVTHALEDGLNVIETAGAFLHLVQERFAKNR